MKHFFTICLGFTLSIGLTFAQSYNQDKNSIINFIKRMYNNTPFEGVKVIDDYDASYLISVISLEKSKYPNQSVMHRVAQTNAMYSACRCRNWGQYYSNRSDNEQKGPRPVGAHRHHQ